jgi:hypothetical protein
MEGDVRHRSVKKSHCLWGVRELKQGSVPKGNPGTGPMLNRLLEHQALRRCQSRPILEERQRAAVCQLNLINLI